MKTEQATFATSQPKRAPKLSPEKRREQLIDCAARIFAGYGIGAARRADVAKEAKVSVPTVYAYFETRDSLARAVLELVDVRLTDIVWGAAKQRDGAFSKILEVTKAFSNSVDQEPDIMKIWLDWSTAFDEGTWPLYENLQKRVASLFCEIIRDGQKTGEVSLDINPEIAAYIVIAGGHMMVQMRLAQKAPVDIEAFLNKLVAGALKPHGTSSNEVLS